MALGEVVEWIRLTQNRGRWWGCCDCGDEPSRSGATDLLITTFLLILLNTNSIVSGSSNIHKPVTNKQIY
jgi:hypothetical protein